MLINLASLFYNCRYQTKIYNRTNNAKKPKEVISVVSNLISDESRFLKIKERIAKLAKPKAAEDIARFALRRDVSETKERNDTHEKRIN